MTDPFIAREAGRTAFGLDPAGYHASRPGYPAWVFEVLQAQCRLGPDTAALEIGAGTGKATRHLLDLGARPLTAVEPDPRLASFLSAANPDPALTVMVSTFEQAELGTGAYDLAVSATAFHWLEEDAALAKIARLLRPGGWWAAFWNVFGDDKRPDPFHEATRELLAGPSSPSTGERDVPFALDTEARLSAIRTTGAFDFAEGMMRDWSLTLDAEQVMGLYATYSNINLRPDRDAILAELGRIARDDFVGRVTRNMTTSLFIARRADPVLSLSG